VRNWVADATAKIKIKADFHDQEDDNFASGLSNTITKDGQTTISADIPWNGKKITNLANPVNPQDAATKNFAEGVRSFNSGMTLSGTSTGTSPNFVSTAWIGFTEADLSIVARKADPAATPPKVDRLMLNSTANGTGPDIGPLAVQTAEARNRIVNPSMQISQENGNLPVSIGQYPADQWALTYSGFAGAAGRSQIYISPDGSPNSLITSFSATRPSPAASDFLQLYQFIEGIRCAELQWGAPQAKPAVLRFNAACETAGTYTVAVSSYAGDQSWLGSFTCDGTGTMKTFVFAIPAQQAGTWPKDSSPSITIHFTYACGSTYGGGVAGWQAGNKLAIGTVNGASATSKNMIITDVGLYLDPQNTGLPPPWQTPDEAQELAACRRYYERIGITVVALNPPYSNASWFRQSKRVSPALAFITGSPGTATINVVPYSPLEGIRQIAAAAAPADVEIAVNSRM
jgi:hypothetical protein